MKGREPYLSAARRLLAESGCTVVKWTSRASIGSALTDDPDWAIRVPEPRGPVSFGTLAHEVAHQLLHRESTKPRWLEEIEAWEWALDQFVRLGLPGVEASRKDARKALVLTAVGAERRIRSQDTAAALLVRYRWVWKDPTELPDRVRARGERALDRLSRRSRLRREVWR